MCDHTLWNDPDGLRCTRRDRHETGHTYTSSAASHLGEGSHHLEPREDSQ